MDTNAQIFNWDVIVPVIALLIGFFLDRIVSFFSNKKKYRLEAFQKLYSPLNKILNSSYIRDLGVDTGDIQVPEPDLNNLITLIFDNVQYLSQQSYELFIDFVISYDSEKYYSAKWNGDQSKYPQTYYINRFELLRKSVTYDYVALKKSLKLKFNLKTPKIERFKEPHRG